MKRVIVAKTAVNDEIKQEFFQKLNKMDPPVEEVLNRDKEDLFQQLYDAVDYWNWSTCYGYPVGEIKPGTIKLEYTLPWYSDSDVLHAEFICTGVKEMRSSQGNKRKIDFEPAEDAAH